MPLKLAIDCRREFDLQVEFLHWADGTFDRFDEFSRFIVFGILGHDFSADVVDTDARAE